MPAEPPEGGFLDLADPARPHAELAGDLRVALDPLAADAEAQRQDAALAVVERLERTLHRLDLGALAHLVIGGGALVRDQLAAFGVGAAGGPFGGGSLVERNLDRWTIFFAILFVANVLVLLKIG